MIITFLKEVFGTSDKFLLYDVIKKKFSKSDQIKEKSWVFGDLHYPKNNISALLFLNGKQYEYKIPEKYADVYKNLLKTNFQNGYIPWQNCIPPKEFKSIIHNVVECVINDLNTIDDRYYRIVFRRAVEALNALEEAYIDREKYEHFLKIETSTSQKNIIESFKPNQESGKASLIKYNQFGTRTGRLVVLSGPKILNIKSEYRDMLTSRYGQKGKIRQLDFKSQEPRFGAVVAGLRPQQEDAYSTIREEIFHNQFDRKIVKASFLAAQYGMSSNTLHSKLKDNSLDTKEIIEKIRKNFLIDEISDKLEKNLKQYGYIKNFFGRVIKTQDQDISKYTLYNYYIQSSCVDMSLLGFYNITQYIKQYKLKIHPIFILHDAIFLDVHENDEYRLYNLKEAGAKISGFEDVKFYMEDK